MSHLDEVVARVDAAIAESVISHMNELLIALSDDALDGAEELEQFALPFALDLEGLDVFARRVGVRRDVVQRLPHGLDIVGHALCAWEPLQEVVEFVCIVQM